uniref:Uncharacterized protein n=1 Tax=Percolomonas cosmopolitus TaxID=63605 RepID=A0A7S1PII9_9EUKA|mmetsp:Transcript_8036/g.29861  ORF Transcript_8036/g.29861 Transcript_8036/m.29861 type:complete len:174 (+) Transcript_8036:154-675(+)|eukprot:CAMPEP_0117440740 /NCGR_PEP_ID=MMETSP0759-20121206/3253_1 /TAXON_ID=63605 /ORGANISM="Percolomonas cosmopolitus, Strain WS" /LENGTH=173 /DNA_ID=CAMNT_0005232529 /DNA_START=102 /DNA_END=623 /DNA_ORIENTATION=-
MAFPKYKRVNPFLFDDPVPLPEVNSSHEQPSPSGEHLDKSAFPHDPSVQQHESHFTSVDAAHHHQQKLSLCREDESVYEKTLRLLREGALAQQRASYTAQHDNLHAQSRAFRFNTGTEGSPSATLGNRDESSFMEDDEEISQDLAHHSKGCLDIRQYFVSKSTSQNHDAMDQG